MGRCPHPSSSIQQFTEICLACGRNVYETDEEYLRYLREQKRRKSASAKATADSAEIERLEKELEITHPGNW